MRRKGLRIFSIYSEQTSGAVLTFLLLLVCLPETIMEYIKKEDLVNLLEKFKKARESKRNCSKQSATEYAIFDYVLKLVDTLQTHEL